jgi:hypothetical protein
MAPRILVSILLLFSILFMPFWISVLFALAGIVYFNIFWEAPVLFLLSDLLYGVKSGKFFGIIFISFTIAMVIVIATEILKKKLKFYK